MTEQWRLLQTGAHTAAVNMAIDRAVLVAHSMNKVPPTVRFYQWKPSAISIGYFQSLEEEVDLQQCRRFGVDYVRRITGGGAVFHEDELTYSIVVSEDHPSIPKNIMESYGVICGAIISGLKQLDIESVYQPINDILVDGKKISGNAQTRKEKTVLQHGTVLMDVDVEKMFSLLKVPNEKIKDKLISDVKERITSIQHVCGEAISFDEVAEALKVGFEEEFDVRLEKGALTTEEKKLTETFDREFFSVASWNHRR
jgi:lipoate-protein ligase A